MKYLTKSEFARLNGISKQAVADRIKRGTLKTVKIAEEVERIPMDDIEFDRVKRRYLTKTSTEA